MICLLISSIIIVIGLIFKIFPPKKINGFYGYRTNTSMRNQKSWDYAQKLGAWSFILMGIVIFIVGIILLIIDFNNELFEMILFLTSMIMMLVIDEIILRKKFK